MDESKVDMSTIDVPITDLPGLPREEALDMCMVAVSMIGMWAIDQMRKPKSTYKDMSEDLEPMIRMIMGTLANKGDKREELDTSTGGG